MTRTATRLVPPSIYMHKAIRSQQQPSEHTQHCHRHVAES